MPGKGIVASKLGLGAPTLAVHSDSFADGAPIPPHFAGAEGRSPALRWSTPPRAARELVLICEDPDAPKPRPFVHWIVAGLPVDARELPAAVPASTRPLPSGAVQGENDMGQQGYFGPAPPPGHGVHHYHFELFAVDRTLPPRAGIDRDHLLGALHDHVVAWGELVGTYQR